MCVLGLMFFCHAKIEVEVVFFKYRTEIRPIQISFNLRVDPRRYDDELKMTSIIAMF